jgi:16S rRNA (adenine1518-N6/adenine1519-N6)-dimethyltransferase
MSGFNASSLPSLAEVIRTYDLKAHKALGQNFLLDINLTRRIARTAEISDEDVILEIGPGPGGLTRALLESPAQKIIVVEKDERFLPALHQLKMLAPNRLEIIHQDALSLSLKKHTSSPFKIISNLPYNIGTLLLLKWFEELEVVKDMTVMLQKEVVERLTAVPRTKSYGRLSILTQWYCEAKRLFDVSPKSFTPPPKVTSSIVKITPRANVLYPTPKALLEKVTAAAFNQRRKMLKSSLKALNVPVEELSEMTSLSFNARAEELTVEDFCKIAVAFQKLSQKKQL